MDKQCGGTVCGVLYVSQYFFSFSFKFEYLILDIINIKYLHLNMSNVFEFLK